MSVKHEIHSPHHDSCPFCNVTSQKGFNIVWEDESFVAFKDRSPACSHHIQLVPKVHIGSVKCLTAEDVPLLKNMEDIGTRILSDLGVPPHQRKLGFHIPPYTSVPHLHLHVQGLPYRSMFKYMAYPISNANPPHHKGFSWFVEVEQAYRILQDGKAITVFPC